MQNTLQVISIRPLRNANWIQATCKDFLIVRLESNRARVNKAIY